MTLNRKKATFRGHYVSHERKFRGHLKKSQAKSPRAGPGQTNRPDAPIPCAVSKNLANRDATCLPWVDTRKPEKRVLEVEGHARDLHMYQHTSLASDSV